MKYSSPFIILLMAIFLSGCSYLSSFTHKSDKNYLSAQSIPPMRIPPGMSSKAFQSSYPVSDREYTGSKEVSLVPPGL